MKASSASETRAAAAHASVIRLLNATLSILAADRIALMNGKV
jgi:hypothetical protein